MTEKEFDRLSIRILEALQTSFRDVVIQEAQMMARKTIANLYTDVIQAELRRAVKDFLNERLLVEVKLT